MREYAARYGDLECTVVAPASTNPVTAVVLLHGYAMEPSALAPFAHSLGVPATFVFPRGPLAAEPSGRAWWPIDVTRRHLWIERHGPRDLYEEDPAGRAEARAALRTALDAVRAELSPRNLVLGGFSQGAMLTNDLLLMDGLDVSAAVSMSSSRIAWPEWEPRLARLAGLPAFISHGRADADLAFSAGESLRDAFASGGANVTWVPFDQGHEIPLVVWRAFRRFLSSAM